MKWKKIGLVAGPDIKQKEQYSHCQLPVADIIDEKTVRVYYAGRTEDQVSHISTVDIELVGDKFVEKNRSEAPVLFPGPIGCFDQFGVYPSSILNYNGKKYLFYIGWIRGYEQPLFYAQIGLALSVDGGTTFQKVKSSPVMGISDYDPCLVTSPNVIEDNGVFRMTYVSGFKWERGSDGKLKSFYNIKVAQSNDLINWHREGITAIDFKDDESNIARSSVIKEDGKYKMWYSYVNTTFGKYRIGYAESHDFKNWTRMDNIVGLDIGSSNDFDSQMMCYPNIFTLYGKKYMLYNGNNFGEKGFGIAVWNE